MSMQIISDLSNILLVTHTLILYPIFKFAFALEKRLTILETNHINDKNIKNKCSSNCNI